MTAPAPDASWIGRTLGGRYRITGVVSAGGMGAVYEAVQLGLERQVAIKMLHPLLGQDSEHVERFVREARAAAALGHPCIVQIIDAAPATADEPAWLAMELVRGMPLSRVLAQQGPLAPERVVSLLTGVLSALEAAHAAGVVHRDLKPSNVLAIDVPGIGEVPKVIDFGIAKLMEGTAYTRLTQTGALMGTPQYMAPEQALGSAVDARTDLHAVGAIAWTLLVGRAVYAAPSPAEVLELVLTREPPPPSTQRADRDGRLDAVVLRAMAKRPEERFQSALELGAALRAAIAAPARVPIDGPATRASAMPITAAALHADTRPPGPTGHREPRSARGLVLALSAVGAAAVLALVVSAGVWLVVRRGRDASGTHGPSPSMLARAPSASSSTEPARLEPLAADPLTVKIDRALTGAPPPPNATLRAFLEDATARALATEPSARIARIEGDYLRADGSAIDRDGARWEFIFVHAQGLVDVEYDDGEVEVDSRTNTASYVAIPEPVAIPDSTEVLAWIARDRNCDFGAGGTLMDDLRIEWKDEGLGVRVGFTSATARRLDSWHAVVRAGQPRDVESCRYPRP